MPPEAAKGELTDRADVYALGCVAYWLLTGEFVFGGATALEIMLGHVQSTPVAPSERSQVSIPPELERLILDCLKKIPAERPTIEQVAERLRGCAEAHRWTAADSARWWQEHQGELSSVNAPIVARASELSRQRGEALGRAPLPERDRVMRIDAGLARLQHHFMQSHIDLPELEDRIVRLQTRDRRRRDQRGLLRASGAQFGYLAERRAARTRRERSPASPGRCSGRALRGRTGSGHCRDGERGAAPHARAGAAGERHQRHGGLRAHFR